MSFLLRALDFSGKSGGFYRLFSLLPPRFASFQSKFVDMKKPTFHAKVDN